LLGLACVTVYFLWGRLAQGYQRLGVFNADQVKSRFVHANFAWQQFKLSPIFGTGARSYEYMERSLRTLQTEDWSWYTDTDMDGIFAHCDWAQLLGDYGFLGGGLVLAILVTHLVSGLEFLNRGTRKESDADGRLRLGIAAGAIAAGTAIAANSIVDFNLHIATNVTVLAVLLGMLANPGRVSFEEKVDAEGMPLVPRHGILFRPAMLCLGVAVAASIFIGGPDCLRAESKNRQGDLNIETDYYTANTAYLEALELDPFMHPASMALGNLNFGESIRVLNSIEARKNLTAAERNFLERYRNSFLSKAAEWYQEAYRIYPRYPYAAMRAGYSYSRLGDFDLAEAWFQKALEYGKASRALAIEYGTFLLLRGAKSSTEHEQLRYFKEAKVYFKAAQDKFRAASEIRQNLEIKLGLLEKKIPELEAKLRADASAAAPQEAPAVAPAPLVPNTTPQ
jgi:tetratricopeptide (TPR) repeat protein